MYVPARDRTSSALHHQVHLLKALDRQHGRQADAAIQAGEYERALRSATTAVAHRRAAFALSDRGTAHAPTVDKQWLRLAGILNEPALIEASLELEEAALA